MADTAILFYKRERKKVKKKKEAHSRAWEGMCVEGKVYIYIQSPSHGRKGWLGFGGGEHGQVRKQWDLQPQQKSFLGSRGSERGIKLIL
jgi:hypothetical protein